MGRNATNNPFVQAINQTVVGTITTEAAGAVNNILGNVQGALSSSGSIASSLAGALTSSGVGGGAAGDILATSLDTLISGSSSYFTSGSPERITSNALANRNIGATVGSNPETQIPASQSNITGGTTYTYPPNPAPYFLKLEFSKYQRPSPFGNTTFEPIGSVILPIPDGGGLNDNTSAIWEQVNLGVAGNILDNIKDVGAIKAALQSGGTKALGSDATEATLYALATVGSSKLGQALGGDDIVNAAESQLGLAPNPSLSQIFRGVGFRGFTFRWLFAPKTADESGLIRDICRYLKAKQLPTFSGSQNGTSYLFNYPAVVKPSFSLGAEYLTDFKHCIIKNVFVDFSPQSIAPSFYSTTKAPTFVALQIDIEEMEYRLSNDYDPNAAGTSASSIVQGQFTQAVTSTAKLFGGS